jgi:hypothetical protein
MQNQQSAAASAMSTQFYDQNNRRNNNCQSDMKIDSSLETKTTFIPIVQTGRPVMTQNRLVTEL